MEEWNDNRVLGMSPVGHEDFGDEPGPEERFLDEDDFDEDDFDEDDFDEDDFEWEYGNDDILEQQELDDFEGIDPFEDATPW